MILAELRGKLSDDQVSSIKRSEDVLTSNVFQCMRYLPPNKGILPFLNEVFRDCGIQRELDLNAEWQAEYYFWPIGTARKREPDVLVNLSSPDNNIALVVEAKYHSGPSPKEEGDEESEEQFGNQLSDEFIDLLKSRYKYPGEDLRLECRKEDCYLLYLTTHFSKPVAELNSAVEQYRHNSPHSQIDIANHLLWTNWTRIWSVLKNVDIDNFPFNLIKGDLLLLLESKGFKDFTGFTIGDLNLQYRSFYRVFWFQWPELPNTTIDLGFYRHM